MIICIALFAAFGILLFIQWRQNRIPTLTGPASVLSRRVEAGKFAGGQYHSSGWNYLVTFRLSDGEELELYVFEAEYARLKEGLTGQLSWRGTDLSDFIPDQEV